MRWEEQGTIGNVRHLVIPRTLSFITYDRDVLLLRGASTKRIWPGKLNGLGGHVEPGETVYESAQREILEETGLWVPRLTLRGLLHIAGPREGERETAPGVLIALFTGQAPSRQVRPSAEGELVWCSLDALPIGELVQDLPLLLGHLFGPTPESFLYGSYTVNAQGEMVFRLESAPSEAGHLH